MNEYNVCNRCRTLSSRQLAPQTTTNAVTSLTIQKAQTPTNRGNKREQEGEQAERRFDGVNASF